MPRLTLAALDSIHDGQVFTGPFSAPALVEPMRRRDASPSPAKISRPDGDRTRAARDLAVARRAARNARRASA